jgi:rhodanese-related sulfurtransferase
MARASIFHATVITGGVLVLCAGALRAESLRWGMVKGRIRREFPQVQSITTEKLAAILADRNAAKPLLLDVRTAAEFQVSYLAGARRIGPGDRDVRMEAPKETPIVTYCSVGYRSARLAERLEAAGFTNVRNLEGSLFQWANEGRPIVSSAEHAGKVHPYNGWWGMLLNRDRRAKVSARR